MTTARMVFRGTMRGHTDVITAIAMPTENNRMAVTASHDKSVIVWDLIKDGVTYGVHSHRLTGHTNVVQDVALSNCGRIAISASLDSTLHWNIDDGTLILRHRIVDRRQQLLSVAFSADNRKYALASSNGTINFTTVDDTTSSNVDAPHADRVSCVRFSPNASSSSKHVAVSGSWDQTVKVWDSSSNNLKLMHTLTGHSDRVNTVAVARDGTRCVSGGNDGLIMLWDMIQGKRLCSLETGFIIYALSMNPARDWVSVGTEESVMIWDLERESVIHELKTEEAEERVFNPYEEDGIIYCTSLSWSNDGSTLFCGYTDGVVRVWEIIEDEKKNQ
ncbi:hypothetical protein RIF29_22130 [Crotalaria pallida]|uniref:Guanine nucleotide-binding protein subunit beta-like protein n=1 Tax=Crotalaria pallida TaxID=3830 RepID=A0AAN9F641_CROPI